jgi:hypothetical protein
MTRLQVCLRIQEKQPCSNSKECNGAFSVVYGIGCGWIAGILIRGWWRIVQQTSQVSSSVEIKVRDWLVCATSYTFFGLCQGGLEAFVFLVQSGIGILKIAYRVNRVAEDGCLVDFFRVGRISADKILEFKDFVVDGGSRVCCLSIGFLEKKINKLTYISVQWHYDYSFLSFVLCVAFFYYFGAPFPFLKNIRNYITWSNRE